MKRVIAEITRTSEELAKAGYDDFETDPAWSRRQIAIGLGDWFEMLGLPRRYAHGKRVIKGPEFIEFDSGNPSHACGYWMVQIEVSEGLHKLIERAAASED